MKSREHIREILREYEAAKTSSLFGNGKSVLGAVDMYKDLGDEDRPVVMMLEMNATQDALENCNHFFLPPFFFFAPISQSDFSAFPEQVRVFKKKKC